MHCFKFSMKPRKFIKSIACISNNAWAVQIKITKYFTLHQMSKMPFQLATRCKPIRRYYISGWMKTWRLCVWDHCCHSSSFHPEEYKKSPSRRVTSEICEYALRWPMILRVHEILLKFQNKAETAVVSMRSMFEKRCHKHCSHLIVAVITSLTSQISDWQQQEEALSSSFQVFGDHFWLLQVF